MSHVGHRSTVQPVTWLVANHPLSALYYTHSRYSFVVLLIIGLVIKTMRNICYQSINAGVTIYSTFVVRHLDPLMHNNTGTRIAYLTEPITPDLVESNTPAD